MPQKVLKCIVELEIQAITCPGVILHDREDVYLSVCILGKYHKSKCHRPIFPILFHEKMTFEKIFGEAVDPGHVAELLELDTATFELIQLVPPVGETLATFVESTREFLYPGPRLTSSYPGTDRDVLMRRSNSFPGIAPKVEFSTSSVIKECALNKDEALSQVHHSMPVKPRSGRQTKKSSGSPTAVQQNQLSRSYERPTVSSQSRSPSPYTRRRMCELSEEARQRLAHFGLGPYKFKKDTDSPPPFVVRHVASRQQASMDDSALSFQSPFSKQSSLHHSPGSRVCEDPSLLGSYRPKTVRVIREPRETGGLARSSDLFDERFISTTASRHTPSARLLKVHSAPSSAQKCPQSPLLNRSSLKERFQTDPSTPTNWEEIHERIKKILKTHRTRQRLTFDGDSGRDETLLSKAVSCNDSLCGSGLQEEGSSGFLNNASVHLDAGEYWSNRAAQFKGKPHRAVFEESMDKIYRNMYRKASSTS
ncbi:spermatogenesis-associated protein 6 [Acipenser ruthenus]|uniref:spermatogenesis-associated protein 6 n=1 Tax=Acipenser ruthenus TaxID=7906 RepID=UPI00145A2B67|nr:spermatogenesis-associated protein 6 [Acipenser ruthenus]